MLEGGNRKADNEYQDAVMELLDLLASIGVKLVATAASIPTRKQDWKQRREVVGPDGRVHGQVKLHRSTSKSLKSLNPASTQRLVRQEVDGKRVWLLDDRRNSRPGRVQQAAVLTDEQAQLWLENNGYTVVQGGPDADHPTRHEAKAGEHVVVMGGHAHVETPKKGKRPLVAAAEAQVVLEGAVKWKDVGGSTPARIEVAEDGVEEVVQIDTEAENAEILAAQEQARREQEQREAEQQRQAEKEQESGPRAGMVAPALLAAGAAAVAGAATHADGPDPIGVDPGAAVDVTTTTTQTTTMS